MEYSAELCSGVACWIGCHPATLAYVSSLLLSYAYFTFNFHTAQLLIESCCAVPQCQWKCVCLECLSLVFSMPGCLTLKLKQLRKLQFSKESKRVRLIVCWCCLSVGLKALLHHQHQQCALVRFVSLAQEDTSTEQVLSACQKLVQGSLCQVQLFPFSSESKRKSAEKKLWKCDHCHHNHCSLFINMCLFVKFSLFRQLEIGKVFMWLLAESDFCCLQFTDQWIDLAFVMDWVKQKLI